MTTKISFSVIGSSLAVNGLPLERISFNHMEEAYSEIKGILDNNRIANASIDLASVDENNHSALYFIIICATLLSERGISFQFLNLESAQLEKLLFKMGFDLKGSFRVKDFSDTGKPEPLFEALGRATFKFFDDLKKIIGFTGDTSMALMYLLRHPGKINFKEVLFYMDRSGANAVPIVIAICFLVGAILAFQGIQQMGQFGLEIYVADLVALSVVRELGPLMVGMICIGRAGSAYAAELGTMKVAEEIDAMKTMGLKPERTIVVPKIAALVVVMPMLVLLGDLAGITGGVIVGTSMSTASLTEYVHRTIDSLVPANFLETIVKGFAFALIIAAVGCFRGFEAENDAKGVGNATTSSVVSGIFLVVLMDFFITFSYPQVLRAFGIDY
ncbi:MAG: ABC transporter permease [Victivallales bacterium]|nr:ABC transporter permease [Victivallales bacterium]